MSERSPVAPDISVCIANYNGDPYVRDCLASVYAQYGDFTFEVLLHDDNSTDDSLALVHGEFPNVRELESCTNVGFCISNNRMVAAARGRYVLLLNNDATLHPGSLQRLLAFARDGHEHDILGLPQYTLIDGLLMDRGWRVDVFLNPLPVLAPGTHEVAVATGACLWIPRELWNEVGGFPEWFESIAEDIYLCLTARLLGHQVIVLDEPGFDHWVGRNLGGGRVVAQRLQTTVRRRALSERNKTFVMLLCYPTVALVIVLPFYALALVVEALFLSVAGIGFKKVLRIYATIPQSVWRTRRRLAALRSRLQHRRQCSLLRFFAQTSLAPHKLVMLLRHGLPKLQ